MIGVAGPWLHLTVAGGAGECFPWTCQQRGPLTLQYLWPFASVGVRWGALRCAVLCCAPFCWTRQARLSPPVLLLLLPQLLAGSLSFYKGQAAVEGLSKANMGTALRDFAVISALYIPVRGLRAGSLRMHTTCVDARGLVRDGLVYMVASCIVARLPCCLAGVARCPDIRTCM
jgi:hypothetical protein